MEVSFLTLSNSPGSYGKKEDKFLHVALSVVWVDSLREAGQNPDQSKQQEKARNRGRMSSYTQSCKWLLEAELSTTSAKLVNIYAASGNTCFLLTKAH